jgi:predicted PurR-regulated permease PerM
VSIIKNQNLSINIQVIFFVLAIMLFYLILKPVLTVFLMSIILTYVFYPVYRRVRKHLKYESLSIFITLILIILLFLLPFVFVAVQIPGQVANIYGYASELIVDKGFFLCNGYDSRLCIAVKNILDFELLDFDEIVRTIFSKMANFAAGIVASIPSIIIGIAFSLFISYFLFKDGIKLLNNVKGMIPLNRKSSDNLVGQFGRVTHSVVFAHLIVALAQGALGTIGFFLFGVPSPLFWGVIMTIFALLPIIGPAIIWVPASLLLFINGIVLSSFPEMGKGIGLFVYGVLIISTIDNILRVKIVGTEDVHPLAVLAGIIGGINLFGLTGIFIGPIVLSLLLSYLKDFSKRYTKGG